MIAVFRSHEDHVEFLDPLEPRIDDPSKPRPSSKTASVSSETGTEKCWVRPGRSQNRRSTIWTSRSFARARRPLSVWSRAMHPLC